MSEKKGVIYTRVSSQKQVTQGSGLDSQHASCLAYAKENNIAIMQTFQDAAFSGKTSDRPGLAALMKFLKKHPGEIIVIFDDISRLSRNVEDYYMLKIQIHKSGGKLISLKDDLESEDPTSQLKENMLIAFADFDRKNNAQRVNSRMRARLAAGYWIFTPPVGMIFQNKVLYPDGVNSTLIEKIYEDYALGKYLTYESIVNSPEARQLINLRTNEPYSIKSDFIKLMLTNKIYMGVIDYPKWGIKNITASHQGFINRDLFLEVQNRINKKGTKKYSLVGLEHFPLKGDLECGSCSQKLVANFARGRSKNYPYYRCDSSKELCNTSPKNIRRDIIHDDFVSLLKKTRIKKEVLKLADKIIEDTYQKNSDHLRGIKNHNESKIKDLSKRKEQQLAKLILTTNASVIKALENEVGSIDRQIEALGIPEASSNDLTLLRLQGQTMLSHPDKAWQQANAKTKKLIFDFIFEGNIKIVNGKIGTVQYSLPYRLMSNKRIPKKGVVELGGIEPPTSCVPRKRSPS